MFSNKYELNQYCVQLNCMDSTADNNTQEWCMWDSQVWMWSNLFEQPTLMTPNLEELAHYQENMWLWELENATAIANMNATNNIHLDLKNKVVLPLNNADQMFTSDFEPVKTRTRTVELPNIDKNLLKILELINRDIGVSFMHCEKSARGLHNGVSYRRSSFVGVLRNRSRWQVLINEGKKKKYIGTYWSEIEAAIAHDFYSMGINILNAKTNFYYSPELIISMIESYFSSGSKFSPSLFVAKVMCESMQNFQF